MAIDLRGFTFSLQGRPLPVLASKATSGFAFSLQGRPLPVLVASSSIAGTAAVPVQTINASQPIAAVSGEKFPTVLQTAVGTLTNTNSGSATFSTATTAGTLLIAFVSIDSQRPHYSVTMPTGWLAFPSASTNHFGQRKLFQTFLYINNPGAITNVTLTIPESDVNAEIVLYEVRYADTINPIKTYGTNSGSSTALSVATSGKADVHNLVISGFQIQTSGSPTVTPETGFTGLEESGLLSTVYAEQQTALVSSAAVQTVTATLAVSASWQGITLAITGSAASVQLQTILVKQPSRVVSANAQLQTVLAAQVDPTAGQIAAPPRQAVSVSQRACRALALGPDIAVVQTATNGALSAGSLTTTFSSPPAAGNTLLAFVGSSVNSGQNGGTSANVIPGDTSWKPFGVYNSDTLPIQAFIQQNIAGGTSAYSFSASNPPVQGISVVLVELAHIPTTGLVIDQFIAGSGSGTTPSLTPLQANYNPNSLVCGIFHAPTNYPNGAATPAGGYTLVQSPHATSSFSTLMFEYQLEVGQSPQSAAVTFASGGSFGWTGIIFTISPLALPKPYAIRPIQIQNVNGTGASLTTTFNSPTTTGTTLVAVAGHYGTELTPTFAASSGWSSLTSLVKGGNNSLQWFSYLSNPGGLTSLTITPAATGAATYVIFYEIAGLDATPLDIIGSAFSATTTAIGTPLTVTGSGPTAVAGELVLSAIMSGDGISAAGYTYDSGYENVNTPTSGTDIGALGSELAIQAASATPSTGITSDHAFTWAGALVTLKPQVQVIAQAPVQQIMVSQPGVRPRQLIRVSQPHATASLVVSRQSVKLTQPRPTATLRAPLQSIHLTQPLPFAGQFTGAHQVVKTTQYAPTITATTNTSLSLQTIKISQYGVGGTQAKPPTQAILIKQPTIAAGPAAGPRTIPQRVLLASGQRRILQVITLAPDTHTRTIPQSLAQGSQALTRTIPQNVNLAFGQPTLPPSAAPTTLLPSIVSFDQYSYSIADASNTQFNNIPTPETFEVPSTIFSDSMSISATDEGSTLVLFISYITDSPIQPTWTLPAGWVDCGAGPQILSGEPQGSGIVCFVYNSTPLGMNSIPFSVTPITNINARIYTLINTNAGNPVEVASGASKFGTTNDWLTAPSAASQWDMALTGFTTHPGNELYNKSSGGNESQLTDPSSLDDPGVINTGWQLVQNPGAPSVAIATFQPPFTNTIEVDTQFGPQFEDIPTLITDYWAGIILAISPVLARQIAQSVNLYVLTRPMRQIPQKAAFYQIIGSTRTVPQAALLKPEFAGQRTIPQSVQLVSLQATPRQIPQKANLVQLVASTRTVPQSATFKTQFAGQRTITQSVTLLTLLAPPRFIGQKAVLAQQALGTRTIPMTAALLGPALRTIPQSVNLTTIITIPQSVQFASLSWRWINMSAALRGTTSITILQGLVSGVSDAQRTIPTTVILASIHQRTIPQSALFGVIITPIRTIPFTLVAFESAIQRTLKQRVLLGGATQSWIIANPSVTITSVPQVAVTTPPTVKTGIKP